MKLSVDFLRNRAILSQVSERNTMNTMNRDHRGRSNDDCPLIVKLQEDLKNERAIEKRKEVKREWESIHPIDRPDWESFKRGIWKGRKLHHIWPMADMEDRKRRAKEWTEHLAKKAEREKKMFEAAEAVGTVIDDEIWDFGPEC